MARQRRTVSRTPATKFAKLQKKMQKRKVQEKRWPSKRRDDLPRQSSGHPGRIL